MGGLEHNVVHVGSDQRYTSHRLGWTAYLLPAIGLLALLPLTWALAHVSATAAGAVLAAGGSLFTVVVLRLYSIELYSDFDGVWIKRGLFPWNRGIYGVKWRDMDEATFTPGFVSWATSCYAVQLAHRYTKANEIQLRHVHHGDEAAMLLNRLHVDVLELAASRQAQSK